MNQLMKEAQKRKGVLHHLSMMRSEQFKREAIAHEPEALFHLKHQEAAIISTEPEAVLDLKYQVPAIISTEPGELISSKLEFDDLASLLCRRRESTTYYNVARVTPPRKIARREQFAAEEQNDVHELTPRLGPFRTLCLTAGCAVVCSMFPRWVASGGIPWRWPFCVLLWLTLPDKFLKFFMTLYEHFWHT